jgi:hypothetical protein
MRARRDSCPDERTCERAFARSWRICVGCVAWRGHAHTVPPGPGFPRRPVDLRMTPSECVKATLAAAHRRALRFRQRLRDRRARAARAVYWAKVSGRSVRSPAVVRAGGTVARCGEMLRCAAREIEDCERAWQDAAEIVAGRGNLVDLLACPNPRVRIAALTAVKHVPPPHRR